MTRNRNSATVEAVDGQKPREDQIFRRTLHAQKPEHPHCKCRRLQGNHRMKAQIRKTGRYCTLPLDPARCKELKRTSFICAKDKMPQTFATACNGLKRQVSF